MLKIRHLLVAGFLLASVKSNACHIEYHTTNGCITIGQTLVIDAKVAAASGNTYYQWQFKGSNGIWTYFTPVTGSNTTSVTINGQSYTVSGTAGGPSSTNVPALTFTNPNANLDDVQVRVIMRNDGNAVNSSNGIGVDLYGGDDANLADTRLFRIRYSASGSCAISCEDNMLKTSTDISGYYGGFEMVDLSSFANNNFSFGRGSSDYAEAGTWGSGKYKIHNYPYTVDNSYGKFAPHSGNFQMIIKGNTSNNSRVWYKSVAVTSGQTYSFSVWVAKVDASNPNIKLFAGSTELTSATINGAVGAWVQVTGLYTATSNTNVVFSIQNSSASSGADNFSLDDICLNTSITIGDKVWFDVNRNGAQDSGEPGISGVSVNLYWDDNNDNLPDNATPAATDVTDANGLYEFRVTPGKYFVQFPTTVPGYTGLTAQDAVAAGSNSTANVGTGKTGTHNFQSNYNMKDAGYLKNITISGTAFNDPTALIDGIVNGTAISSVSGSALYANLFKGTASPYTFVASVAITGGTYTFSNLAGNTGYTVAISTVAATAASTSPSSTLLPSTWLITGENIGTGAGNDGAANGMINVSLADINIGNVNFGMQQPPTANTATLAIQNNPGGTSFVTVPATNFGGTDAGGAISYIKITGFPTNTTTLKVNGNNYVAATVGTIPNIPTNAAGQPTQTIEVDPVDGPISVVIPYKTIDNGGAQSANTGSVTVPFSVVPDLTPQIVANPNIMNGVTSFNITIKVSEVAGAPTTGSTITVLVPKDPRLSFTYNSTMTMLGTTAVNNSVWSFDNSNPFLYIFTSNTVIPSNGFSTIGLAASFNPQSALGVYVLSSVIGSGSGGEVRTINNSSSVSLNYFPN